jgi:hypothetical protein
MIPGCSKGCLSQRMASRAFNLDPVVRVEWVKARARKQRWVEEVVLLKEEMR